LKEKKTNITIGDWIASVDHFIFSASGSLDGLRNGLGNAHVLIEVLGFSKIRIGHHDFLTERVESDVCLEFY